MLDPPAARARGHVRISIDYRHLQESSARRTGSRERHRRSHSRMPPCWSMRRTVLFCWNTRVEGDVRLRKCGELVDRRIEGTRSTRPRRSAPARGFRETQSRPFRAPRRRSSSAPLRGTDPAPARSRIRDASPPIGSVHSGSASNFRALFDETPEGVLLSDRNIWTDVNPAACRMLGYAREELVGRSVSDLIPPDNDLQLHRRRGGVWTPVRLVPSRSSTASGARTAPWCRSR